MWTYYKRGKQIAVEAAHLYYGVVHRMQQLGADFAQRDTGDTVRPDPKFSLIQGGKS